MGNEMPDDSLVYCPNCRYALLDRSSVCPYCGVRLGYSRWKKTGAWILLILIAYGLIQCHLRIMGGLDRF